MVTPFGGRTSLSSLKVGAQVLCKEYKFNDLEMALISQYILTCVQGNWFREDKGIVEITKYTNERGQKCWYLMAWLDDRYKDNPPNEYAWCDGDLALIYQADAQRNKIVTPPTAELLTCLEEVVLDKLYIRPPRKDQFIDFYGKRIKVGPRHCLGRCVNDLIVVFHEDGTYTKELVF